MPRKNQRKKTLRRNKKRSSSRIPFSKLEKSIVVMCVILWFVAMFSLIQLILGELKQDVLPVLARSKQQIVIALDPGHGGIDRGAEYYAVEVEVVEQTSDALSEYLENDKRFQLVKTRKNGEGMSIADRAQAANSNHADLFLSIHCNSDDHYQGSGFECYPQPPRMQEYSRDSLRFARLIAKKMEENGHHLRGEGGVRYIYYELNENGNYQKKIREQSDQTPYEEKTFGVLERVECPGVLVEQCFLTSEQDIRQWASKSGVDKAARIYYEAICEYFQLTPQY